MTSSSIMRGILFIAMALVIVTTLLTVSQVGWSVWSALALVCALAIMIIVIVQRFLPTKPGSDDRL